MRYPVPRSVFFIDFRIVNIFVAIIRIVLLLLFSELWSNVYLFHHLHIHTQNSIEFAKM